MKDFFKNVLANITAIIIVFILPILLLLIFAVAGIFRGGSPSFGKNSVLVIDDKMVLNDSPTDYNETFSSLNAEDQSVLLYDMLEAIRRAKTDDRISGISIEADNLSAGTTQIDDVRAALEDFKKSGKFVYAYGNNVQQSAYYLGTAAQQYFLHPAGSIELRGMSTEVPYLKQMLDKFGIGMEVIRHGDYKAAVEPFLRDDMSAENREQLSTLLNDVWNNLAGKMAASRKLSVAEFQKSTDSLDGYIPETALSKKLVDKLIQKSEYEDFIKTRIGLKTKDKLGKISFAKYAESTKADGGGDAVAILYASGDIVNGYRYQGISARKYVKEIQKLAENDKVKAVVFRVNSPGGSANASDEILFELKKLKAKKPLIVSFGDYAASGGYYISMAADKIYTQPNTITGSIGVFGVIPNVKQIANRNGIHAESVKTNANADGFSVINGLSPGTRSVIEKSVEQTYRRFAGFVMQNRKKSFEQVDALGGGRVWSGIRAKELGLADETGSLMDAVNFAAAKANLKKYKVESYPKQLNFFEQLMDTEESNNSFATKLIENKIGKENYKILQQLSEADNKSTIFMECPIRLKF